MVQATQLRPGMIINFKGDLHSVFRTEHRTPGKAEGIAGLSERQSREFWRLFRVVP